MEMVRDTPYDTRKRSMIDAGGEGWSRPLTSPYPAG